MSSSHAQLEQMVELVCATTQISSSVEAVRKLLRNASQEQVHRMIDQYFEGVGELRALEVQGVVGDEAAGSDDEGLNALLNSSARVSVPNTKPAVPASTLTSKTPQALAPSATVARTAHATARAYAPSSSLQQPQVLPADSCTIWAPNEMIPYMIGKRGAHVADMIAKAGCEISPIDKDRPGGTSVVGGVIYRRIYIGERGSYHSIKPTPVSEELFKHGCDVVREALEDFYVSEAKKQTSNAGKPQHEAQSAARGAAAATQQPGGHQTPQPRSQQQPARGDRSHAASSPSDRSGLASPAATLTTTLAQPSPWALPPVTLPIVPASSPWVREHDVASGKSYYWHKETRETTWDVPAELANQQQPS